jgi:hypothetical protein
MPDPQWRQARRDALPPVATRLQQMQDGRLEQEFGNHEAQPAQPAQPVSFFSATHADDALNSQAAPSSPDASRTPNTSNPQYHTNAQDGFILSEHVRLETGRSGHFVLQWIPGPT